MMSTGFKITLLGLTVVAGVGTFAGFRLANARLRAQVAALQQRQAESTRLREGNREAKALLARVAGDKDAAAVAIQAEVERLRREITGLEARAVAQRAQLVAQTAADAAALNTNRDPRIGLTRLEHCQNLGQATPGAAFQTLVWAALKGDETLLAQITTLSAPVRAKAEGMIAGLPESVRGQWTPEKFAAMFFTGAFNEVTAAQVMAEVAKDPQHVELSVRLKGGEKEPVIPLRWELGPNGWRVVFEEKFLGAVQKRIANATVRSSER